LYSIIIIDNSKGATDELIQASKNIFIVMVSKKINELILIRNTEIKINNNMPYSNINLNIPPSIDAPVLYEPYPNKKVSKLVAKIEIAGIHLPRRIFSVRSIPKYSKESVLFIKKLILSYSFK
jgi:hypothetical protein